MKKKLMALFTAIIAILGFGFTAGTAMADPYGQTGAVTGNTVSFSFSGFTPNGSVTITADDNVVADIVQVISRTFTANAQGNLSVKYILKDGVAPGTTITAVATDNTTGKTATSSATTPAIGSGDDTTTATTPNGTDTTTNGATNTVAQTGAAIAPYVVAVVLLAAAGCAVFAARKAGAR